MFPTFATNPTIAGGRDPVVRVSRLTGRKRWLDDYREALQAWRAGNREVEFPFGTYWLRVGHGARVKLPSARSRAG